MMPVEQLAGRGRGRSASGGPSKHVTGIVLTARYINRKFLVAAIVLVIISGAGCVKVMDRHFQAETRFQSSGPIVTFGTPVATALDNNSNRPMWDSQNFMLYLPIFIPDSASRPEELLCDIGRAVDSISITFLPSGETFFMSPRKNPYEQEMGCERMISLIQDYSDYDPSYCMLIDTFSIPASVQSISVRFTFTGVDSTQKQSNMKGQQVFIFTLYRKEGTHWILDVGW
jgi:hypothetical protein